MKPVSQAQAVTQTLTRLVQTIGPDNLEQFQHFLELFAEELPTSSFLRRLTLDLLQALARRCVLRWNLSLMSRSMC